MQVKAEYKVVHTLHEQSGFGWDEGHQRVTGLLPVWEAYIKVMVVFSVPYFWKKKLT